MRRVAVIFYSTLALGLGVGVIGFASVTYVVKNGDTLSKIANDTLDGDVWGKSGSLESILVLNPQIENSNVIYPGQKIELPGEAIAQEPAVSRDLIRAPAAEANAGKDAPLPATSPIVIATLVPEEFVPTAIVLTPYYLLSNIRSTDSSSGVTSNLTSKINTGLGFSYSQQWTSCFRTSLDIKIGTMSVTPIADSGKSLASSSAFMDSVGIGAVFGDPVHSAFSMKAEVSDTKELFESASSSTSVGIDTISTPELHLEPGFRLIAKNPLVLGVGIPLGLYLPSSTQTYSSKLGTSFGGKVFLLQDLGRGMQLSVDAGIVVRNQNTTFTQQTESDLGASIGISFPLGRAPQ